MASITGYCAVCREVFNAEERRPHCIPCGHLFCLDCLTRMCGPTFGSCPFCRTAFYPEDIRWLFFNFELDGSSDHRHYASSNTTAQCPTVLGWLFDAREGLEKRLFDELRNGDGSSENLAELQAEINAWLSAYEATEMPRVPENKALEVASGTLAILSQRTENMEDLRLQLKVMRQDVRLLQKTAAEILRARRNAELKIKEQNIEIRALRDLNRLYRQGDRTVTIPAPLQTFSDARRTKRKKVPPCEIEEFHPSKSGLKNRGTQLTAPSGTVNPATVPDPSGNDVLSVKKSVTWFRTSLRRSAQPVDM